MDMELRLTFPPTAEGAPNPLAYLRAFARREAWVRVLAISSRPLEARVSLYWSSNNIDGFDAALTDFLASLPPPASFTLAFPYHSPANRHLFHPPSLASLPTTALRSFSVQDILEVPSAWTLLASSRVREVRTSHCCFTDADYTIAAARLASNNTLVTFCVDPGCSAGGVFYCQCFRWVRGMEDGEGIAAFAALLARNRGLTARCRVAARAALVPARVLLLARRGAEVETLHYREVVRSSHVRLAARSRSRSRRRAPLCEGGAVASSASPTPLLSPDWRPRSWPPTRILSLPAELLHLILRFVSEDPDALSGTQWARLFKYAVDRTSLEQAAGLAIHSRYAFARQMERWLDTHDFV